LIKIFTFVFFLMILIGAGGFIFGDDNLLELFYVFAAFIVPVFLALIAGVLFFSSQIFKSILYENNPIKKLLAILGGLISVIITAITSFYIFAFWSFFTGAVDISS